MLQTSLDKYRNLPVYNMGSAWAQLRAVLYVVTNSIVLTYKYVMDLWITFTCFC